MKIKTLIAAAALASASTTSFAGNTEAVVIPQSPEFVAPVTAPSSSGGKYLVPIVACLIICSALASSSGT
jgi:hypothetical protein